MIVPEDILSIPRFGGINIRGVLLPQYRGCNPTQWAILNGETRTGVMLHEMSAGIDEGKVIAQKVVPLMFDDSWQSAHHRIANATDELISENIGAVLVGRWKARAQDASLAQYHRRRTSDDGFFKWEQPVVEIYNFIRTLVEPLPGAFYLDQKGDKNGIAEYLTPAEVTQLKYGL